MPDTNTIADEIRARLAEVQSMLEPLNIELDQLTKLAAALDGDGATPPVRPVASPKRRRARTSRKSASPTARAEPAATPAKRGRPRGGGNRAQQAVAKIGEQPGITVSELAQAMGISPNYLYRVLPRLEKEATVVKRGKGYHLTGAGEHTTVAG